MSMSGHNCPGSICSGCDQDSTVTTSNTVKLDTYDQLLVQLLSVKDFISRSVFHCAFRACFNVLLDRLSEAGQRIPYVPLSEDLIYEQCGTLLINRWPTNVFWMVLCLPLEVLNWKISEYVLTYPFLIYCSFSFSY